MDALRVDLFERLLARYAASQLIDSVRADGLAR
jgi:hypothetical protein